MKNQKPPFEINNRIITLVADIAELSGKLDLDREISLNPVLRRTNRIKTIHGSLAIEQNTLNLEQVTSVINGKRVLAPPKDIAEVKNAYEIYERIEELDPYSIDDMLLAHRIMTRDVVEESGVFRSRPVGIVDSSGNILHFGSLPQYIPDLIFELFEWVRTSDVHILIRSCVFHYEFELIHPFSDGNGRIGRLWHTVLLCEWNKAFAWLPIESIIHDHQTEYYEAINQSNINGDSTMFIEFMLSVIKEALTDAALTSKTGADKTQSRDASVINFLNTHPYIKNSDVRMLFNVSAATANRILAKLVSDGKLLKVKENGHWSYRKNT